MNSTVVIRLGSGNLYKGFPQVTAQLWDELQGQLAQFVGDLPPAPALVEQYRLWRSTYDAVCYRQVLRANHSEAMDNTLEIEETGITQVSQTSLQALSQRFQQQFNSWLQSEGFAGIERQLRSHLNPDTDTRIIIEATDDSLRRLPWHCWELLRDYPHAEIALSRPDYQYREIPRSREPRSKVRILAVLGDRRGIDINPERQFLASLPDAETEFLVTPTRQVLSDRLWDAQGWDILFFAGHSQTEADTGRLYINENPVHNSLTIDQLTESLSAAIDRGLKLAIFNSCDGIGLAQALGRLHIPQVVVMREPVPNRVAQEFLRAFLDAYAIERLPLYRAVRQARRKLQGLEDKFPDASWLPMLCQNPAAATPTWLQLGGVPPCPYRGLFAFQEADAPLFFGRESFTQTLVTAVKKQPFVAVVGPSGSGKSSVVFAGLVPELRAIAHRSTPLHIAAFRPGPTPFDAVAESLAKLLFAADLLTTDLLTTNTAAPGNTAPATAQSLRFKTLELSVEFQHSSHALYERIDKFIRQHPDRRLILIADQFEELYTLCPEVDRQSFLDSLLNAVQFCPAFTLVLTLRADFYGHALSDRRFSDLLQGAVYNLGPMSQTELQEAIAQPAAKMQVQLEPGLADQLAEATSGHAGRLPLLEFALTRLWSRQQEGWLTHQAYREIGGVEEAIATHAESVYAQLHPLDQLRMQRILVQLVEPGAGTEASRRIATLDDVGEENWDLVTHLASTRLLMTNRSETTGEETVELVHEALLRHWGRLEHWLQEDEEFRRWQEDLRVARRQWENSRQDEDALLRRKGLSDAKYWYDSRYDDLSVKDKQFIEASLSLQERENHRQKRRRQLIVSSLTGGLLTALALAGVAWNESQKSATSDVRTMSTAADALFVSGQNLDALITAVRARQKLKTLVWPDPETQSQVDQSLRQAIARADERNRLPGHNDGVTSVVYSPRGDFLASASKDRTIRLWNPDGRLLKKLEGHTDEIWGVAISPDGQWIASASNDHTARVWRRDGAVVRILKGHQGAVNAIAFSPDGETIVTGGDDQTVRRWKLDGSLLQIISAHDAVVNAVAFSPDGQTIASASNDQTVKLWNRNGILQQSLRGHTGDVRGVAFSPDGRSLVTASTDETIKVWHRDGTLQATLRDHGNRVFQAVFSADGKFIVSASHDETVKFWKPDGTLLRTFTGHRNGVVGVAISADGQTIASASLDRTVRLWQINNPVLSRFRGHEGTIWDVIFSPDGQLMATASGDRTVKVWHQNGDLISTLKGHTGAIYAVAFSPDGETIASASKDQTIRLWKRDGTLITQLKGHKDSVTGVMFSPDGQFLASSSADHTVRLWPLSGRSKFQPIVLKGHTDRVFEIAISPDSQVIASASNDQTVRLWQRDGTPLQKLNGHQSAVNYVRFSPDGQTIATASNDRTVRLWKRNGTFLMSLEGHQDYVVRVVFHPDGKLLASTSSDQTIKLWKLDGTLLTTLNGYREGVIGAAFSPDGQILASTSVDRTVVLWNLKDALNPDRLLTLSCDWLEDYLRTSAEVSAGDRHLCSNSDHDRMQEK